MKSNLKIGFSVLKGQTMSLGTVGKGALAVMTVAIIILVLSNNAPDILNGFADSVTYKEVNPN